MQRHETNYEKQQQSTAPKKNIKLIHQRRERQTDNSDFIGHPISSAEYIAHLSFVVATYQMPLRLISSLYILHLMLICNHF